MSWDRHRSLRFQDVFNQGKDISTFWFIHFAILSWNTKMVSYNTFLLPYYVGSYYLVPVMCRDAFCWGKKGHRKYCIQSWLKLASCSMANVWPTFLQIWKYKGFPKEGNYGLSFSSIVQSNIFEKKDMPLLSSHVNHIAPSWNASNQRADRNRPLAH